MPKSRKTSHDFGFVNPEMLMSCFEQNMQMLMAGQKIAFECFSALLELQYNFVTNCFTQSGNKDIATQFHKANEMFFKANKQFVKNVQDSFDHAADDD